MSQISDDPHHRPWSAVRAGAPANGSRTNVQWVAYLAKGLTEHCHAVGITLLTPASGELVTSSAPRSWQRDRQRAITKLGGARACRAWRRASEDCPSFPCADYRAGGSGGGRVRVPSDRQRRRPAPYAPFCAVVTVKGPGIIEQRYQAASGVDSPVPGRTTLPSLLPRRPSGRVPRLGTIPDPSTVLVRQRSGQGPVPGIGEA